VTEALEDPARMQAAREGPGGRGSEGCL
jgi:hypothetical protein